MSKFEKITLKSVCKYVNEQINLVNIDESMYISTENMLPNKSGVVKSSKLPDTKKVRKFQYGDILISNIRPYFKKIWYATNAGGCSNDVLVIRSNEGVDSKFLYYVLSNDDFFNYAMTTAKGTKMPRGDKNAIMQYKIPLISNINQKKITNILNLIDSKILTNNNLNDNLDKKARLHFEKFYDASDEWEVLKIGDIGLYITDYVANGSFKSLKDNVTLYDTEEYALFMRNTDLKANFTGDKKYVNKHSYEFLSKSKLFGGELIISNVGDVGSVYLCPHFNRPMTLGNNVILIKSTNSFLNYNYFLYYFFRSKIGQNLLDGITGGSAQSKFNKTDFKNSRISVPINNKLDEFNKLTIPIYKMIEHNIFENYILNLLRDTLLPKLMSGEIDLDNYELEI